MAGGYNKMISKVPSRPNRSVILCLGKQLNDLFLRDSFPKTISKRWNGMMAGEVAFLHKRLRNLNRLHKGGVPILGRFS